MNDKGLYYTEDEVRDILSFLDSLNSSNSNLSVGVITMHDSNGELLGEIAPVKPNSSVFVFYPSRSSA